MIVVRVPTTFATYSSRLLQVIWQKGLKAVGSCSSVQRAGSFSPIIGDQAVGAQGAETRVVRPPKPAAVACGTIRYIRGRTRAHDLVGCRL